MRTLRAYYYGCISFIDFQVGRIVAALEQTGQLDNTLIVLSADHGELLGDFGCFGKRSYHDACSRIPLVVRHPRLFAAGRRCATPVSLLDVAPTLLAAAGASFASHAPDGTDLAAAAAAGDADRTVFSQLNTGGDAIYTAVSRRWKYVYSAPDGRELLFDRVRDPGETKDLAGAGWDRRLPHVPALAGMRAQLLGELRAAGETAALDGDGWRAYPRKDLPANPDGGLLYQDHSWADQRIEGYSE